MKRFLLILWFTTFLSSAIAQEPQKFIKGKVVDENQISLQGANLLWQETNIGAITDLNGFFKLEEPVVFPKNLIVSYVGFESQTVLVKNKTDLHIVLKESVNLKSVEVEAKMNTSSLSMVSPIQVENISSGELEKAACCNLAESFETNASVDVSFTDAISGARQIQMLGLDGIYSQITQENIPLIRGLYSAYGLSFTPGSWIESIQISKGVGSVVNGFESITGQINLELYKPKTSYPLFLNGYASSSGRLEKNIIFSEQKGNWISATLLHASSRLLEHDNNDDGFHDHPLGYQLNAINRWNYVGNEDIGVTLVVKGMLDEKTAGSYNTDNYVVDLENKILEFFSKTGWKRLNISGKSMGLQTNFRIHDFKSSLASKYFNASQYSAYLNYIYQSYFGSTDHSYKTGISYNADSYEKEGILDTNYTDLISGAYIEYSYLGNCDYTFIMGLRTDYHNKHGFFYTPRVHFKWNLTENSVVRFSGGRGFRIANPIVENIGAFSSNRSVVFSENMDPEIANNFGGNITKCFYLFGREGTINMDLYYTFFESQLILNQENQGQLVFENLKGSSNSKVVQLDFNYELVKDIDVKGSYKRQEVNCYIGGKERFTPFTPKERMMLNLAYQTPVEDWKFDVTLQYVGRSRIPMHQELLQSDQIIQENGSLWSESFQKVNSQITRTVGSFDLYVGGENILDYKQENPILNSFDTDANNFDASLVWAPTMGRMFYFGFRYKMN